MDETKATKERKKRDAEKRGKKICFIFLIGVRRQRASIKAPLVNGRTLIM
jgi:hypothetical protein